MSSTLDVFPPGERNRVLHMVTVSLCVINDDIGSGRVSPTSIYDEFWLIQYYTEIIPCGLHSTEIWNEILLVIIVSFTSHWDLIKEN